MRRWSTFLGGVLSGGLLVYGLLCYHIVHTDEGLHLVPKVSAEFASTYVDIRDFTPRDWIDHPRLLEALSRTGHDALLQSAAADALNNGLDKWLGSADRTR